MFLSHSTRDMESAQRVCSRLEGAGIACWIAPRDIRPGSDWAESIMVGIAGARAMVLLLTGSSSSSVQVRREVEHAVNAGIPIVPVVIGSAEPSMALRYYISAHQWMEAPEGLTDGFLETLTAALAPTALSSREPSGLVAPEPQRTSMPAGPAGGAAPEASSGRFRRLLGTVGLVALVLLAALLLLGRVLRSRSLIRSADSAAEEGRWLEAAGMLEDIEDSPRTDSLRRYYLGQGVRQLYRETSAVSVDSPEEGDRLRSELIPLVHEYFDEYGFDGPGAAELLTFAAEGLRRFGDLEEAGNLLMEIVWNDRLDAETRLDACLPALDSYLMALSEEQGADSNSIRRNMIEAIQIARYDLPECRELFPPAPATAGLCLSTGDYRPALEIARWIWTDCRVPVMRAQATHMIVAALEGLDMLEQARAWRALQIEPDSLSTDPSPPEPPFAQPPAGRQGDEERQEPGSPPPGPGVRPAGSGVHQHPAENGQAP